MIWNDSPPPSWYEPLDELEDDEPAPDRTDELAFVAGVCSWFSLLAHDDD